MAGQTLVPRRDFSSKGIHKDPMTYQFQGSVGTQHLPNKAAQSNVMSCFKLEPILLITMLMPEVSYFQR